jgi:hypothetical protein
MSQSIELIDISTERTTAITDLFLAVIAFLVLVYLLQIDQHYPWKAALWAWAFAGLTLAAALGAVAHGFKAFPVAKNKIWSLLFLSLGLTVALFTVGTIFDIWGLAAAQTALPAMLVIGLAFFGVTLIWSNHFFVFIIYQAVAMLFALLGYGWLALAGQLAGAWFMVGGIFITLLAAAVQASGHGSFRFIWEFDHNGIYHLIQIVGVILLALGLRTSLLAAP